MNGSRRRVRSAPWRPSCEGLERRLALSSSGDGADLDEPAALGFDQPQADYLSIVATRPASGAEVSEPVSSLAVEFDRPIDPFSLLSDVQLMMVNDDGSLTPIVDENVYTLQDVDPDDPSLLVVALDATLAPGRYQIFLWSGSMIAAQDGAMLDAAALEGPISEFTVRAPEPGSASTIELGRVGPEPLRVEGRLDFTTSATDVALYRFELTPEHTRWRLGVEVEAQRLGSPLNAALTLFNSERRPLMTAEAGRPDAPADPYLFAGLTPGTYYVGVSGTGNLPTNPGGYDLAREDPGQVVQQQEGGAFLLSLVADPAETPTSLVDFRLDRADPTSSEPTGFLVRFSGAIRTSGQDGLAFDTLSTGLQLLDDRGQSWPIAATGYDEATATLKYIFRERLPQGNYTLRVASLGALSDLSGRPVVGHDGRAGDLARFAVTRRDRPDPSNLGAFYPNEILHGRELAFELEPGETQVYTYTNLYPDTYLISLSVDGGPVTATLLRPGDSSRAGAPRTVQELAGSEAADGVASVVPIQVGEGQYQIRIVSRGDRRATVKLSIGIGTYRWESLLVNGIGQGAALNLRLVAPGSGLGGSDSISFDASPTVPASGALAMLPAAFAAPVAVPGGPATIPGSIADTPEPGPLESSPTGQLAAAAATGLFGLPEPGGQGQGAAPRGAVTPPVLVGLVASSGPGSEVAQGGEPTAPATSPEAPDSPTSGAVVWLTTGVYAPSPSEDPAEPPPPAPRAWPLDNLLARVDEWVSSWYGLTTGGNGAAPSAETAAPAEATEPLAVELAGEPGSDADESSGESLDARLGLGLAALLTIELRELALRRARRDARTDGRSGRLRHVPRGNARRPEATG
jgi:hypothetical protein